MNAFIFTQRFNSPDSPAVRAHNKILCVANGAAPPGVTPTHACDTGSFQAGSKFLREIHGITQRTFLYDNTLTADSRRNSIFGALGAVPSGSLELIAYLGHGSTGGLESACIRSGHINRFASLINDKCAPKAAVVFYACSAGAAGGFAEMLSRVIQKDIWVYGHSSWGSYSNLTMFRRYPGGVPWTRVGGVYTFWKLEREAFEADAALAEDGANATRDLRIMGL